MENISKARNPLSLQIKVDDFIPATAEEKESLVIMRESVSFWKDGIRRFRKNKIAMTALSIVLFIFILCFIHTNMQTRSKAAKDLLLCNIQQKNYRE